MASQNSDSEPVVEFGAGSSKDTSGSTKDSRMRLEDITRMKCAGHGSKQLLLPPRRPRSKEEIAKKKSRRKRPSRRWLIREVDRLFTECKDLVKQLVSRGEIQKSLVEKIKRLEAELAAAKEERGKENEESVNKLKARNMELSQDVFIMQSIVVRVNSELQRYQDRLRQQPVPPPIETEEENQSRKLDDCPTLSEDSGMVDVRAKGGAAGDEHPQAAPRKNKWIRFGEITAVTPLLFAYDESLKEKSSLIADYRAQLEICLGKMKDIIAENEMLRQRLHDNDKRGEITYSEWLVVQKDAIVAREQNELLMRQAKLGEAKFQELRGAFQLKLDDCTRERDITQENLQQYKTELYMLKGRFNALQEEYTRAKESLDTKIPQSVHMASINECKRLFEELKSRYEREREELMKRLVIMEKERPGLEEAAVNLHTDRELYRLKSMHLESVVSKLETRMSENQEKLMKLERERDEARRVLTGSVAFSGELLMEQESLVRRLQATKEEAARGSEMGRRLETLKHQLQNVEKEAEMQMSAFDRELRDKAVTLTRARLGEVVVVANLKETVARQDALIKALTEEKRKAKEDLDLMYAVAGASDQQ